MCEEQSQKCGVYLDVFEQSFLTSDRPGKSWSLFASFSTELVAVALAILIPLARTDHLPGFHWKSVSVSAPVKTQEAAAVERTSSAAHAGPVFTHRIFVPATQRTSVAEPSAGAGWIAVDPPGPMSLDTAAGSGGIAIETLISVPPVARPPRALPTAPASSGPIQVSQGVQMA